MEEKLYSFQPPEFNIPEKKSKAPLIFILIFVLILLAGFTGILASRIWDPLWNPFRPSPEVVIARAMKEMEKVKTVRQKFLGEIEISGVENLRAPSESKVNFKLSADSKQDISQPEKPKVDSKFELEISVIGKEKAGAKFAISGEYRAIDEELYIKFTKLPAVDFLRTVGIDLSYLEASWIKIDRESIRNLQEKMGEELTPEIEKFYKEKEEREKRIQKELQEKIKEKLMRRKWFVIKKELPDEKIDGVSVYHYVVSLNNKEIINLIPEIWKEIEKVMLEETGAAPTIEEEEMKKILREIFEKIGEIEGEVWIGKKNYLLYKLSWEKTIDLKKFETENEGKIFVSVKIENSEFNQPVKIEAPSEYKTLEEVLSPIFKEIGEFFFGVSPLRLNDEKIISELLSLRMVAEVLYMEDNLSYKNLCQNYALNKKHPRWGKDLETIENAIKEAQGGSLKLSCYSSTQSYCIVVDLASPDKGKYCIDSFGNREEIAENLSCLGKGTSNDPYSCPVKEGLPKLKFPINKSFFQASLLESVLRFFKK